MRLAWALLLVVVLTSPASGVGVDGYRSFTVPWDPPAGHPPAQGPTSMRVGPGGDIFIATASKRSIQRFSPAGSLVRSYDLPAAKDGNARINVVDFVCGPNDELYVLQVFPRELGLLGVADAGCQEGPGQEPSAGVILRVGQDGTVRKLACIPGKGRNPRLLDRIEMDAQGRVYVHDGFDNGILRFDAAGQMTDCGTHEGFSELALDRSGRLHGAEFSSQKGSAAVTLWQVDLGTREKRALTELSLEGPASSVSMVGVDDRGQVYVETTHGPNENPTARTIRVVAPDGTVVSRIAAPERPSEFNMFRARAILPSGGVLTARATKAGLVVEPHLLRAGSAK